MKVATILRALLVAGAALTFGHGAGAQEMKKITIGLSSSSVATSPTRLAYELGLFRKHGIDPKIQIMANSNVAGAGLISGSLDFHSMAAPEVVIAQGAGQKVVAVLTVFNGFSGSLVLSKAVADKLSAKPSSSVGDRLKAIDGLLIASPTATSTMTLSLKGPMEAAGHKIRFTYVEQSAMYAALEKGAIDGYMSGAPFYAPAVLRGTGVVWLSGPKGEFPNAPSAVTLNTMKSYADANPDLMKALRAVYADFSQMVGERPAEVKAAFARLYPELDAATVDYLYTSESGAFRARPLTAQVMQNEIEFVKKGGVQLPQLNSLNAKDMILP